LLKVSKTWWFYSISKSDGRPGIFEENLQGVVQEISSLELLGGPGADFLREIAFCSIRSLGLLR
jgi:hypothetical protein